MKKINSELARIQKELKAPKERKNTFGGFNYRNCEDILEAVKPVLGDLSLNLSDEVVMIGDRFYIKATAILSNGEENITVSGYAREPLSKKGMDEPQITGSASSYARKYALNGLFCIDDNRDADDVSHKHNTCKGNSRTKACDLTMDQIRAYRVPEIWNTKYKGMMLREVANDTTEAGTCKGLGWMESVIDKESEDENVIYTQDVIRRYLNEAVTA